MAILNKDDFFNRINEMVGTDTSDTALSFLEDMGDTYNDMENRLANNGEDWEKKYHDLDEAWKTKYKSRFFSSAGGRMQEREEEDEKETVNANITIDDLFEKKGR